MNALLGHTATLIALLLAGVGAAAAFIGGRRGDVRYVSWARRAGSDSPTWPKQSRSRGLIAPRQRSHSMWST